MKPSNKYYEVVKAKSQEEALSNCGWKVGELAEVVEIKAIANSNDTYTVYPLFGKIEKKKTHGSRRLCSSQDEN